MFVQDIEDALMRAAAQGPGGGDGSAGGPLSVSPDYIDALVEAVKDPGVGRWHSWYPVHQKLSAVLLVDTLGDTACSLLFKYVSMKGLYGILQLRCCVSDMCEQWVGCV